MTNRHSIELQAAPDEFGLIVAKLFIDGHDMSHVAGEVRIVLTAGGGPPRVEVDLVPVDGLSVKLEGAGLMMAVKKPDESDRIDFSRPMDAYASEHENDVIPERWASSDAQQISGHISGIAYRAGHEPPTGMADPRK